MGKSPIHMSFSEWVDSLTDEVIEEVVKEFINSPEHIEREKNYKYIEDVGLDNIIFGICNFVNIACAGFFNTSIYDDDKDLVFPFTRDIVELAFSMKVAEAYKGEDMTFFGEAVNEFELRGHKVKLEEFHGQGETIFHIDVKNKGEK